MQVTDALDNALDIAGEERLYRATRRFWHPVMYAADLGGRPHGVVLLDEALVLVRLAGQVRCFRDLCVHRGTALSLGFVEGDQLRCAYHGWPYGPDGVCTSVPARFGDNVPSRARLEVYMVEERYGLIWVCLEGDPDFPIPDFPEWEDPNYHVVTVPPYDWDCSAARRTENFIDLAHFPWLHEGILGTRDKPEVPTHEVHRGEHTLTMQVPIEEQGADKLNASDEQDQLIETLYDFTLTMPYTVYFNQTLPQERHFAIYMAASPIGRKVTRCFTYNARNYRMDDPDEDYITLQNEILEQDRPVVESQRPEELPVDLTAELHIRGADLYSLEYRRWLIEVAGTSV